MWLAGGREREQGPYRLNAKRRKARLRLIRRPPVLFVDEDNLCRNPRPLHERLAAHLFTTRVNRPTIATDVSKENATGRCDSSAFAARRDLPFKMKMS